MSRIGLNYAFKTLAAGMAIGFTTPVALAQEKKKPSVYDNDESSEEIVPVPGTSVPAHDHDQSNDKPQSKNTLKTEIVNGVRVRSSEFLEENTNKARQWLIRNTDKAKEYADNKFEKYLNYERNVVTTVASLKSAREEVLPNGIYVLIATLTGSIVSRRRNIALRALTPIVFGVSAFAYFMPGTFKNTRNLTWQYEQKVPQLAQVHENTQKQLASWVKEAGNAADSADKSLQSGVRQAREFVEEQTGLKLSELEKEIEKKKKN